MFSTVLFDLDGTLLDTLGDIAAAGNHTLSALGLPTHPRDAYRHMVGNGVKMLVRRMLPENQRGEAVFSLAFSLYEKTYAGQMLQHTQPYPGIPELLRRLRERGLTLGVLSNKPDNHVPGIVQHYFPGIFSIARGLRDGEAPKPDPANLLAIMHAFGAGQKSCLYVGDSDVDVLTAKNAGLPMCGVCWGFRGRDELLGAGADYLAHNADELGNIIMAASGLGL